MHIVYTVVKFINVATCFGFVACRSVNKLYDDVNTCESGWRNERQSKKKCDIFFCIFITLEECFIDGDNRAGFH
jgi:hypothetical protein